MEMEQKIMEDLLNACCGYGEETKSYVTCTSEKWEANNKTQTEEVTNLSQCITEKAYVHIYPMNDNYWMVDLSFLSEKDYDMKAIWKALNASLKIQDSPTTTVISRVVVMPKNFEGYYIDLLSPIFFTLTSNVINGPVNTIRMLFEAPLVNFMYTNEFTKETIDKELAEEEKREMLMEMQREEQMEEQACSMVSRVSDSTDKQHTGTQQSWVSCDPGTLAVNTVDCLASQHSCVSCEPTLDSPRVKSYD